MKIFITFIMISPKAQKKNNIALDFYLNEPPRISLEYIKTIEKNISIPAHAKIFPIVIITKLLLTKENAIPKIEKYHAKRNTLLLPNLSDKTPKRNAINPALTIKNP